MVEMELISFQMLNSFKQNQKMKTLFKMFAIWLSISMMPIVALFLAWAADAFNFDIKEAASSGHFMIIEIVFTVVGLIISLLKSSK